MLFSIKPLHLLVIKTVFIFMSMDSVSWAQEKKLSALPLLNQLKNAIYITSEVSAEQEGYAENLEKAANDLKILFSNKDYDSLKDIDDTGSTILHHAAMNGYYSLVKVILSDDHGKQLLNLKDKDQFTPLDWAKLELGSLKGFYRPLWLQDITFNVTYLVNLSFYLGKLNPYEQTIKLLEQQSAKCSRSLKELIIFRLLKAQRAAENLTTDKNVLDCEKKLFKLVVINMQEKIEIISKIEGNEEELLFKITSVLDKRLGKLN